MSSYEFWDELGKIFNAVVAYQEKNVEFNKRFISPWIRLGNVFDKQDRKKEAVEAYQKAIELDPENAHNWFELGNVHFKMQNHDLAADAFRKAVELDEAFGHAYSNLALSLANQGRHQEAIPLYTKGIELLEEDKDRAIAWNRLGNAYRKLNEYEKALEAFHKADELDKDNGGFRDDLDEEAEAPAAVNDVPAIPEEVAGTTINPLELIVKESEAEETGAEAGGAAMKYEVETVADEAPAPPEAAEVEAVEPAATDAAEADGETAQDEVEAAADQAAASPEAAEAEAAEPGAAAGPEADGPEAADAAAQDTAGDPTPGEAEKQDESTPLEAEMASPETTGDEQPAASVDEAPAEVEQPESELVAESPNAEAEAAPEGQQTVTVVVQESVETYTESLPAVDVTSEEPAGNDEPEPAKAEAEDSSSTTDTQPSAAAGGEPASGEEAGTKIEVVAAAEDQDAAAKEAAEIEAGITKPVRAVQPKAEDESSAKPEEATNVPAAESAAEATSPDSTDLPEQMAYEEFLKDTNEPIHLFDAEAAGDAANEGEPGPEPVQKIDESGDLEIEMDTKNAHVWNELGNVYFNSSAFDDAVVAYSKAIELDRWFAWPYSNLALTYVQKRRFVEAILLYQRSIELFSADKDKAISWNRLGNVYRRLNDYENAIAAYQRADALDPDNATLSLQSRFSLLGNYAMDQKPSYVS